MVDLKEQGVVLGKRKKNDVAEECRFAYKDIDQVMAQQLDSCYTSEKTEDSWCSERVKEIIYRHGYRELLPARRCLQRAVRYIINIS